MGEDPDVEMTVEVVRSWDSAGACRDLRSLSESPEGCEALMVVLGLCERHSGGLDRLGSRVWWPADILLCCCILAGFGDEWVDVE